MALKFGVKDITPVGDRYLIKRDESPSQSVGGILLPDVSREKCRTGIVVAVGDGDREQDKILVVHKGDRVLFATYAGHIPEDDSDLIILGRTDILAVLNR